MTDTAIARIDVEITRIDAEVARCRQELDALRTTRAILLRGSPPNPGGVLVAEPKPETITQPASGQGPGWTAIAAEILRDYAGHPFKKAQLVADLTARGAQFDARNVSTWLSRGANDDPPKLKKEGRDWIYIKK
jgi:hypothetical protein